MKTRYEELLRAFAAKGPFRKQGWLPVEAVCDCCGRKGLTQVVAVEAIREGKVYWVGWECWKALTSRKIDPKTGTWGDPLAEIIRG